MVAIGQFLNIGMENAQITMMCAKYEQLINQPKQVTLVAHSLGAFMVAECSMRFGKVFNSFLFAPYVPRTSGKIINKMSSTIQFKKIFYEEDFIANNLLTKKSLLNAVVLSNNEFIFGIKFLRGHSSSLFSKNLSGDVKKLT